MWKILKFFLPKTEFDHWFDDLKIHIQAIMQKYPFSKKTKARVILALNIDQKSIETVFNHRYRERKKIRSIANLIAETSLGNLHYYQQDDNTSVSKALKERFLGEIREFLRAQEETGFHYEE